MGNTSGSEDNNQKHTDDMNSNRIADFIENLNYGARAHGPLHWMQVKQLPRAILVQQVSDFASLSYLCRQSLLEIELAVNALTDEQYFTPKLSEYQCFERFREPVTSHPLVRVTRL